MKKSKVFVATVVAMLMLITSTAFAGYYYNSEVSVSSSGSNRIAYGTLSATRASASSTAYIGCTDSGNYAQCYALDAEGDSFGCTTTNANHLAAIRSIGEHSRLYMIADSNGNCTTMSVSNRSRYILQ